MSRFHQILLSLTVALALISPLSAEALPLTAATALASAQNFFQLGVNETQSGDYRAAIKHFTQAIQIGTNSAAYSNRCLAYLQLEDYQNAVVDCTMAIQQNPGNSEAYLNRGLAHFKKGNPTAAIADYNRAVGYQPHDFRAYYNRGLAQFEQGDYAAAIADYDQALHHTPLSRNQEMAVVHNDRGLAHFHLGNVSNATFDFSQAIRLNAGDARAYYNRGCVCQRQGNHTGAIQDFTQSLQRNPNLAEAYVNRGLARHQLGYQQLALEDLHKGAEYFYRQRQMTAYHQTVNLIQKLQQLLMSDSEVA